VILGIAGSALLAGCGGSGLLERTTLSVPRSAVGYLTALGGAQARLAAAERQVPRRARTPAALARAISLLAAAVRALAADLAAIRAPGPVRTLHARLVEIVRSYREQLASISRLAVRPRRELDAATMLLSATTGASGAFGTTIARIEAALSR
jgi:hypothetical protein